MEFLDDGDDEEDRSPGWLRLGLEIPRSGIDERSGDVVEPADGQGE